MTDQAGSAGAGNPGDGAGSGGDGGAGKGAAPWYGEKAAPEVVGFLQTKGWDKDPLAMVQGYQHLETFIGADKAGRGIVLPKDANDAEGWGKVFEKLGRPAKPEEYQLPVPEGDDGALAKHFAPILHEAGLTRAQAVKVAEAWNKFNTEKQKALDAQAKDASDKAETALKLEWGKEHDKHLETARRGAKALGITEEQLDGIEASLGYGETMKLFQRLGVKLGEDQFTLGEGTGKGAITTPEAARARLEALKRDKDWMDRWAKGDLAAKEEKDRLDAILAAAAKAA